MGRKQFSRTKLICAVFALWAFGNNQAIAQDQDTQLHFSAEIIEDQFGPFIKLRDVEGVLYFVGEILSGDVDHFRRATRQHEVDKVALLSPGGTVQEGLELANIFRDKSITAFVPKNYVCASACSFLFFGAAQRYAEGGLGVHQFSKNNPRIEESESEAQALAGRILENFNDFDTPSFVAERMLSTPPEKMYWLNSQELNEVNNLDVSLISSLVSIPTPTLKPKPDSQPLSVVPNKERKVIQAIQKELNRLGCNVGSADGVVGRKTRNGMRQLVSKLDVEYNENLFSNVEFLRSLGSIERRICPKPKPAPTAPDLSGNWSLNAKCSWAKGTVRGWFALTRKSRSTYAFHYKNNLGQTGSGTLKQNGLKASMYVRWSSGAPTRNTIVIEPKGNTFTGSASNNCRYTAWRS